jgi:4-oxalocrotonate tautomerase
VLAEATTVLVLTSEAIVNTGSAIGHHDRITPIHEATANGGECMPIIRVEMWPGRTHAQKAELAKRITEAVVTVAKTTPEATIIVFEDVAKENWAVAGTLASDAKA